MAQAAGAGAAGAGAAAGAAASAAAGAAVAPPARLGLAERIASRLLPQSIKSWAQSPRAQKWIAFSDRFEAKPLLQINVVKSGGRWGLQNVTVSPTFSRLKQFTFGGGGGSAPAAAVAAANPSAGASAAVAAAAAQAAPAAGPPAASGN